jgi:hypothetical protein
MLGLVNEIAQRIEDRLPVIEFNPTNFVWTVNEDDAGTMFDSLMGKFPQPLALRVSVHRGNDDVSVRGCFGNSIEVRPKVSYFQVMAVA